MSCSVSSGTALMLWCISMTAVLENACFNYLKPGNPHGSLVYGAGHEYLWDTQAGGATHSFLYNSFIGMYFPYTMCPLKVYNLMFSSLITDVCTSIAMHFPTFSSPPKEALPASEVTSHFLTAHSTFSCLQSQAASRLLSDSMDFFFILDISFQENHAICGLWLVASSTWNAVCKVCHGVACISTLLLLLNNMSLYGSISFNLSI